jgi:hypothetical protein
VETVVEVDVDEGKTTTHVHVAVTGLVGHGVGPSLPVHFDVTFWPWHDVLAGQVVYVVVIVSVTVTGGVVGQLHLYVLVIVFNSHASHLLYVRVQLVGVEAVTQVVVGGGGIVLQPGLPLHSGHWQSQVMVLFWGLQSTHWLYVIVHDVGVATWRQDGVGGDTVLQPGVPSTGGHVVVGHLQS